MSDAPDKLTIDELEQMLGKINTTTVQHFPNFDNLLYANGKGIVTQLLDTMRENERLRAALENIGNTAQCSHHAPKGFCLWVAQEVGELLNPNKHTEIDYPNARERQEIEDKVQRTRGTDNENSENHF